MKNIVVLFLIMNINQTFGQKPPTGTYTYAVKWAEWPNMTGPNVKVVIKKDSVFVYALDSNMTLSSKGDILAKGILIFHKKTSQWIIATKLEDKDAPEVGGCSDGPTIIDFKNKWFWLC